MLSGKKLNEDISHTPPSNLSTSPTSSAWILTKTKEFYLNAKHFSQGIVLLQSRQTSNEITDSKFSINGRKFVINNPEKEPSAGVPSPDTKSVKKAYALVEKLANFFGKSTQFFNKASRIIFNPERREEVFIPVNINNDNKLGFYVFVSLSVNKDFNYSGFDQFVTAGCLFGSSLQGIVDGNQKFPLIKHNLKFYSDQKIEFVEIESPHANPYEEMLFDQFEKQAHFIDLSSSKCDFILLSINQEQEIDLMNLQEISKKNNNKPILINRNGQICIYGMSEKTWNVTNLDNKRFETVKFPEVDKLSILKASDVTEEIRQEITSKKGHISFAELLYHLPYYDYMLFGVELFIRGRMTFDAFKDFCSHILAKKEEHVNRIEAICRQHNINVKIESPFKNLFGDLNESQDIATQILHILGLTSTEINPIDDPTKEEEEKKLVQLCLKRLISNSIEKTHRETWEDFLKNPHFLKSLFPKGCDFVLMSMSHDQEIDLNTLQEISKKNNHKPILINRNGQICIYGLSEKTWNVTNLDNKRFENVKFPMVGKFTILKANDVTEEIRQEITSKKAHTLPKNSLNGSETLEDLVKKIDNLEALFKIANAVMVANAAKGKGDFKTCSLLPLSEKQIQIGYAEYNKTAVSPGVFNATILDPLITYGPYNPGLLFYYGHSPERLFDLIVHKEILNYASHNVFFNSQGTTNHIPLEVVLDEPNTTIDYSTSPKRPSLPSGDTELGPSHGNFPNKSSTSYAGSTSTHSDLFFKNQRNVPKMTQTPLNPSSSTRHPSRICLTSSK